MNNSNYKFYIKLIGLFSGLALFAALAFINVKIDNAYEKGVIAWAELESDMYNDDKEKLLNVIKQRNDIIESQERIIDHSIRYADAMVYEFVSEYWQRADYYCRYIYRDQDKNGGDSSIPFEFTMLEMLGCLHNADMIYEQTKDALATYEKDKQEYVVWTWAFWLWREETRNFTWDVLIEFQKNEQLIKETETIRQLLPRLDNTDKPDFVETGTGSYIE